MIRRKNLRNAGLRSRKRRKAKRHPLIPKERKQGTVIATWIKSDNDFGHGNYCKYASPGIMKGKIPQEGDSPTIATSWIYRKVDKICDCHICKGFTNRFGDFHPRVINERDLGFAEGTTIELHSDERYLELNLEYRGTTKVGICKGLGKILWELNADNIQGLSTRWSNKPFLLNGKLYWPKATIEKFDRLKHTEKPLVITIKLNGSLYDDKIDVEGYRQMNGRFDKRMGDR